MIFSSCRCGPRINGSMEGDSTKTLEGMAEQSEEVQDSPMNHIRPAIERCTAESALQRERGLLELNRLLSGEI